MSVWNNRRDVTWANYNALRFRLFFWKSLYKINLAVIVAFLIFCCLSSFIADKDVERQIAAGCMHDDSCGSPYVIIAAVGLFYFFIPFALATCFIRRSTQQMQYTLKNVHPYDLIKPPSTKPIEIESTILLRPAEHNEPQQSLLRAATEKSDEPTEQMLRASQ